MVFWNDLLWVLDISHFPIRKRYIIVAILVMARTSSVEKPQYMKSRLDWLSGRKFDAE